MTIKVTYNITDVYVTQDVSPVYINVSYSTGSSGGSAVWGGITGTLSNQTDLQSALDAKFDDPTGTTTQYIDGTGALQTFPLTLPVLQQVRNQTGGTLTVGTVVYISGATGNLPTVTKAIATGDATSAQTLGMVSAAIANNGTGYVVVIGTCSGLDTSAYTEGQQLYLSYTTAGAVTTTKPYAPYHLVYIGIVTRAHPTLGTVEVRVQNGYELDEIHNVDALNPNNNDGIFYNSTTSLWEHKQISTALGYTPANSATTLTINGVTYDLSANRSWTISTGISGSGASGQVAYWDGTTSQAGSNNLFWDNTNGRLGIGTNVPATSAEIATSGARLRFNQTVGGSIFHGIEFATSGGVYASLLGNQFTGEVRLTTAASYFPTFYASGSEGMRLTTNRNLILQNGGTFTDSGQRLQVQGTTLLNGNVTFSSATGMFWDAANGRLGIGTNVPTFRLEVQGGDVRFANALTIGTVGVSGWQFSGNTLTTYTNSFIGIPSDRFFSFTDTLFSTTYLRIIKNTGNVLIGSTTDTGERLQVTGTMKVTSNVTFSDCVNYNDTTKSLNVVNNLATSAARGISVSQHADSVAGALINYNRSRGSSTTPTNVSSGDLVGIFVFNARVGGAYTLDRASLGSSMTSATGISLYMISGTSDANYAPTILAHHSGNVGIGLGGSIITTVTEPTALLDLAASSTARASLRIRSGTAPTSPNNGDIWFDGTDIKMRIGGVTKTFTLI